MLPLDSSLLQVLLHLGENMPPDQIDRLIKMADTDNDGFVDWKEFTALVLGKNTY